MHYIVMIYRLDGGVSVYTFERRRDALASIKQTFGKCHEHACHLQTEFILDGEVRARLFPRMNTGAVTQLQ